MKMPTIDLLHLYMEQREHLCKIADCDYRCRECALDNKINYEEYLKEIDNGTRNTQR